MSIEVLFAGIPVPELAPAAAFYERFFRCRGDMGVTTDEVMRRFTKPGGVYLVRDAGHAGHAL